MLVEGYYREQQLIFSGDFESARAMLVGDESNEAGILRCWMQIWMCEAPTDVYLVTNSEWRRLLVGISLAVKGDGSYIADHFSGPRCEEIASFYRAVTALQRGEPCPPIAVSDLWSQGRRQFIQSFFSQPKQQVAELREAFHILKSISHIDAARVLTTYQSMSFERAELMDEVTADYAGFDISNIPPNEIFKLLIVRTRMSLVRGHIDEASKAVAALKALNINHIHTGVEISEYARMIGEEMWARHSIEAALLAQPSKYEMTNNMDLLLAISIAHIYPDRAEEMVNRDHLEKDINISITRDEARKASELRARGMIAKARGNRKEAESLLTQSFLIWERGEYIYRCALVASMLQEISSRKSIEWRNIAERLANRYGNNSQILLKVHKTIPYSSELRKHVLDGMRKGWDSRQIAANLNLAHQSARKYASWWYGVFRVQSRHELIHVLECQHV